MTTMLHPTKGMKTQWTGFQLAEIADELKVGDPSASICARCLCFEPILNLTLNAQNEFVCASGCEEYDKNSA